MGNLICEHYSAVPGIVGSTLGTEHVLSLRIGIPLKMAEHPDDRTAAGGFMVKA